MMGVMPGQLPDFAHQLHPRPTAFGGNCGVGASELVTAILNMREHASDDDIIVAKSNCGIPEFVDGEIVYSGTVELMSDYARLVRDAGAKIIGGCCGTTPDHVAAMRAALKEYEGGERPSVDTVVARLGEISTGAQAMRMGLLGPEAGGDDEGEGGGRRRRGGRSARRRTGGASQSQ
jgi:5-methyltetrahydrofolate--homocysteine methyltransferase